MIDLSIQEVSDGLHVALGALFVLIPVAKDWTMHPALTGSLAGIIYGLVKEFWFDMVYESPETSGGFLGGIRDFCGYVVGIVAANAIFYI